MAASRNHRRTWLRLSLPLALLITASAASQGITRRIPAPKFPRIVSPRAATTIPLKITNNCEDTIWPAIASQAGTGPSTGGFKLETGTSKDLTVSADWQGRVWGRTNCTFNAEGTGPSNLNGINGGGQACQTGDCNGVLNCVVTVSQFCNSL
jgi:Thaumatin family